MKIERVNSEIRKILMEIITEELKDPRVSDCEMLSIMDVDTTGDLKYCNVYVSVMGGPSLSSNSIKAWITASKSTIF